MRIAPIFFILFISPLLAEDAYELKGIHFLATFKECDHQAIHDSEGIGTIMENAIKKTGATILSDRRHYFHPQGTTQVFLLSESHASIHTYPEHRACFVDLFTCGDHCDWKPFYEELKSHFKTENSTLTLLERTDEVKFLDPYKSLSSQ